MSSGLTAQIACLLEATARKPGNVHRLADFPGDAHYLDFLLSAAAIVEPLNGAATLGVGRCVLNAVEATRRVIDTNANLGIILLLAPLAAVPDGIDLRSGMIDVLNRTTIDDCRFVYRAIRLAAPGGLGIAPEQDVRDEPTITLVEAMRLASDRDAIARQYANGYVDVFDLAIPALARALQTGQGTEAAIVSAFTTTLAAIPDTLIVRKRGREVAEEASRRARIAVDTGDFASLDTWLRADGHARNPGATADLIAAALFVALRSGTIVLPLASGRWESIGASTT